MLSEVTRLWIENRILKQKRDGFMVVAIKDLQLAYSLFVPAFCNFVFLRFSSDNELGQQIIVGWQRF